MPSSSSTAADTPPAGASSEETLSNVAAEELHPGDKVEFGVSRMSSGHVQDMQQLGYFGGGVARVPGAEEVPEQEGELVVFEAFFAAGLRLPTHRFVAEVLRRFKVQVHQLTPNAVVPFDEAAKAALLAEKKGKALVDTNHQEDCEDDTLSKRQRNEQPTPEGSLRTCSSGGQQQPPPGFAPPEGTDATEDGKVIGVSAEEQLQLHALRIKNRNLQKQKEILETKRQRVSAQAKVRQMIATKSRRPRSLSKRSRSCSAKANSVCNTAHPSNSARKSKTCSSLSAATPSRTPHHSKVSTTLTSGVPWRQMLGRRRRRHPSHDAFADLTETMEAKRPAVSTLRPTRCKTMAYNEVAPSRVLVQHEGPHRIRPIVTGPARLSALRARFVKAFL
jgi:hypothetical protein